MAKIEKPGERIEQRSVGLRKDQWEFLDENRGISVHLICRDAVDKQMEIIE